MKLFLKKYEKTKYFEQNAWFTLAKMNKIFYTEINS